MSQKFGRDLNSKKRKKFGKEAGTRKTDINSDHLNEIAYRLKLRNRYAKVKIFCMQHFTFLQDTVLFLPMMHLYQQLLSISRCDIYDGSIHLLLWLTSLYIFT